MLMLMLMLFCPAEGSEIYIGQDEVSCGARRAGGAAQRDSAGSSSRQVGPAPRRRPPPAAAHQFRSARARAQQTYAGRRRLSLMVLAVRRVRGRWQAEEARARACKTIR